MKVHHSITDGVGGMALLAELVDLEREPEPARRRDDLPAVPAADSFGTVALVRDSLTHTSRRMLGITRRIPGRVTSDDVRGACAIRSAPAANVASDRAFGRPAARAGDRADVAA